MSMKTRFNYVLPKKRDNSNDGYFYKYTLKKRIRVLSTNKDGSVDKYVEENFYSKEKCSWKDFIKSHDLGSTSEQVINHIKKGTPLVTAHTLPTGDYTKIGQGAEINQVLKAHGLTLDMIVDAVATEQAKKVQSKDGDSNNEN